MTEGDSGAAPVTRGEKLLARMVALGLNYSSMGREADMSRVTVKAATCDKPTVGPATWRQLEGTLDRLEHETGTGIPEVAVSTPEGLIEFEVTGDFGVRVVVRGPVNDAEALERSVTRLIQDIRSGDSSNSPQGGGGPS